MKDPTFLACLVISNVWSASGSPWLGTLWVFIALGILLAQREQ